MTTTQTESEGVLRLGGWAAYANGVVSAVGLVFLVAMYASFAVGATSPGLVFGWINDVSAVLAGSLMLPLVVALHVLLRPHAPIMSGLAMVIGFGANLAIMVLQSLLVVGALTFQDEIGPVLIAVLVLVVWLVLTGYLGSSSGALPHGNFMGRRMEASNEYVTYEPNHGLRPPPRRWDPGWTRTETRRVADRERRAPRPVATRRPCRNQKGRPSRAGPSLLARNGGSASCRPPSPRPRPS